MLVERINDKRNGTFSSVQSLSRVRLLATPWTAAYQAPPSMGFARQEYWSGVPLPSPMHVIVSENKFRECVKIYEHV